MIAFQGGRRPIEGRIQASVLLREQGFNGLRISLGELRGREGSGESRIGDASGAGARAGGKSVKSSLVRMPGQ
jgi:hypothetical protein